MVCQGESTIKFITSFVSKNTKKYIKLHSLKLLKKKLLYIWEYTQKKKYAINLKIYLL